MDDVVLNNLTPKAEQVLALARREAGRLNHNYLGTEHLLLAVIKLGESIAVDVLKSFGIKLDTLKKEIEKRTGIGHNKQILEKIPYTPRVKKVLWLAAKEAKALNHTYVGTEHILLGILQEGDGLAAKVLKDMGVEFAKARQCLMEILDPNLKRPEEGNPKIEKTNPKESSPAPLLNGFTESCIKVLTMLPTVFSTDKARKALEEIQCFALEEIRMRDLEISDKDAIIHTLHERLMSEASFEFVRLSLSVFKVFLESKNFVVFLQDSLDGSLVNSFAEKNFGTLLQIYMGHVPMRSPKDFLAMWPKEEGEEKPPQPPSPQG